MIVTAKELSFRPLMGSWYFEFSKYPEYIRKLASFRPLMGSWYFESDNEKEVFNIRKAEFPSPYGELVF